MAASTDFISYGNANVAALQVTAGLYPSASSTTTEGQVGIPLDIREKVQTRNILFQSTPVGCKLYPGLKIFVEDTKEEVTVIKKKEGAGYTGALWSDWEFDMILDEFKNDIDTCRDLNPSRYAPIKPGVYTLENLLNYLYLRESQVVQTYHTLTIRYLYGEDGYISSGSSYEYVQQGQISSQANYPIAEGQGWSWNVQSPVTGWYVSSYSGPTDSVDNMINDVTKEYTIMRNSYTITLTKNNEGGTVWIGSGSSASQIFHFGDQCIAHAAPSVNYTFSGWWKNGVRVSTSTDYAFFVNGTETVSAEFTYSPEARLVTTQVNPSGSGTVTGGGTFNDGQTCSLEAIPYTGNRFSHWDKSGIMVGTAGVPTYSFVISEQTVGTYTANFSLMSYNISASVNPSGRGTVTGTGTYDHGQSCLLRAEPEANWSFLNWTENGSVVSSDAEYSFTVTGERSLVANFTENATKRITLTLAGDYDGCSATLSNLSESTSDTTTSSSDTAEVLFYNGDTVRLSATAGSNYVFSKFKKGQTEYTDNPTTFTSSGTGTTDQWYAYFEPITYTITTQVTPNGGGTVESSGTGKYGTEYRVEARPNTGYRFVSWSDGGSTLSPNNPYTFTVTGNVTLTAVFVLEEYTVTGDVTPSGSGTVDVDGHGSSHSGYTHGQTATLTASALSGYQFGKWSDDNVTNPRTVTVTGNATYTAMFTPEIYTITATADPVGGGSVSGGGQIARGQTCTLTATPATGYAVGNWKDADTGNIIPGASGSTYSFVVDSSRNIAVEFIEITNVDVYAWIKYGQAPEDLPNMVASDVTSKPHTTVRNIDTQELYGLTTPTQTQTDKLTGWVCTAIPKSFEHWAISNEDPEYSYATYFVGEAQGGGCDLLGAGNYRDMTINNIPYLIVQTPQSLSFNGTTNSLIFGGGSRYLNENNQLPQFGNLWSDSHMHIINVNQVSSEQNG